MLEPDDRHTLLEALRPPPGFRLDFALGTTYSLDLHALLAAPLAFALLEAQAGEGSLDGDPAALLEAVRRHADRMTIFCQAGQISVPGGYRAIVAYLEEMLREVTAPREGFVFHPKVWVIRYASGCDDRLAYRLLCLSRNLTFDRSWDTILRLEGEPVATDVAVNRGLVDFVRTLPGLAVRPVPHARADAIERLAVGLRRVEFAPPEGLEIARFWPVGTGGPGPWPFETDRRRRLLAVSPFVADEMLLRLGAHGGGSVLISRPESLDSLDEETLEAFEEVLVLSQGTQPPGDDEASGGGRGELLGERAGYPLSGLHAKLFVIEDGWGARVFTGSANATNAAFGGNIEFMVELRGRKNVCGIDSLLGDPDNAPTLRSLTERYLPGDEPAAETPQERLARLLEQARRQLAGRAFKATVGSHSELDEYSISLETPGDPLPNVEGVEATVWPITLPQGQGSRFLGGVRFNRVSFDALTAFFAVELTATENRATETIRFVITAELVGAPQDREDRLLTRILRNRSDVLRYLQLLLALDDQPPLGLLDTDTGGEAQRFTGFGETALFETMARALARDPQRLDHAAGLIEGLRRTPGGQELLPPGLDDVWEPIWQAREALRK